MNDEQSPRDYPNPPSPNTGRVNPTTPPIPPKK